MRTTKSEVEAVFKLWVASIDGVVAKSYNDNGRYRLDHNSVYGGYEVQRVVNEHGGVTVVSGPRLSAYYFVTALRMSMRSLEEQRLNQRLKHVAKCPKKGDGCAHFTSSAEVK